MWIVVSQFNCPSYSVYVRFRELFQSLHYSAVHTDPALLSVTRNGDAWSQLPLWMELTDLVGQILEAQLDYDEHYWFQWWTHLGISSLHGKGEQGAARLDSLNHINRNNWWWTSLIGLITGQRSNWTEFYELNSPSQLLTTLFRNKRGAEAFNSFFSSFLFQLIHYCYSILIINANARVLLFFFFFFNSESIQLSFTMTRKSSQSHPPPWPLPRR